jgi:CRISPR-associated protein Csb1
MLDLQSLAAAPRLLIESRLRPVQTDRFQPTGFPDLGPATYRLADGTEMLLVESAQSMANRAEAVCWDEAHERLVPDLSGLPYIHVDIINEKNEVIARTASVLEAHRLNSPYVLEGRLDGRPFREIFEEAVRYRTDQPVDRRQFLLTVFKYDPAALLHGLFMSNVGDGRMRLARAMSSFIEARDVRVAQSGGVKNDRVNASGDTARGFGNVPFARTEYTARDIRAYLNLDLRQIRSFGLPGAATRLLTSLAMYKFVRLLEDGLRLRTACDLVAHETMVTEPKEGFPLPKLAALQAELPAAIAACRAHFAEPAVTRLRFSPTEASAKASRKKSRDKDREEGGS